MAVSTEPPIRLICAGCGRPLPVKPGLPPYLWLKLNLRRWILLLILVVMPLLIVTVSPWSETSTSSEERPRLGRVTTGRVLQKHSAQQSAAQRRRQRP
ncbi:MAG: hypothetical protein FJ070_05660 [Cyanobacteria bacterium K_DeepCast_150m_m2_101]|nr:hypothetical protein [Cyanobacteria bacterium K_DeepCast_150m_m2_101]